jgi:hypothetical protein
MVSYLYITRNWSDFQQCVHCDEDTLKCGQEDIKGLFILIFTPEIGHEFFASLGGGE